MSSSNELQNFIVKMTYLIPIATNFLDNKAIQVPINEKSTLATLNKLFKVNNQDANYFYNLWLDEPRKFVKTFIYTYWSNDPLYECRSIELSSLKSLSFPVAQYIALALTNINNRDIQSGLIYDLDEILFSSIDELIELFSFMQTYNFQPVDYTNTVEQELGTTFIKIPSKTVKEIKDEKKAKYDKEDKDAELKRIAKLEELKQNMLENGLTLPTMTFENITIEMAKLTKEITGICLEELKIRRDFSERLTNLLNSFEGLPRDSETFYKYLNGLEELKVLEKEKIDNAYSKLQPLREMLTNLHKERELRDAYDKFMWKDLSKSLSDSLKSFSDESITTVLLEDQQT